MKASGRTLDTEELGRELDTDRLPLLSIYAEFPDGTQVNVIRATELKHHGKLILALDAESSDSVLDRALSLLSDIADGKGKHSSAARAFLEDVDY